MIKHIRYASLFFFIMLINASCSDGSTTLTPPPTDMLPAATPQSFIPYLAQEPPGMEPEIFAPGIVSDPDFSEYSGVFSPDGTEYYFFRYSEDSQSKLLSTRVIDGEWIAPQQLAFTAEYGASEPLVTFDNKRLYFMWNRPRSPAESEHPAYYVVERTHDGWSEPRYAGQGMFLSSSRDGQLYTTDMSSRNINGRTYLATISTTDGLFTDYERLAIHVPFGEPAHPCIAPDGSYLLFDVDSGHYLFLSFKDENGNWGEPIDLTDHGFDPMAGGAYISPDGNFLFFSLHQDIWWVDSRVIDALRPSS